MAVVFSDDFNRADSDSLGGNWNEYSGDADINTNKIYGASTAIVYNTTSIGSADYFLSIDFDFDQGAGDEWVIPFIRAGTSGNPYSNAYTMYCQSSSGGNDFIQLLKRVDAVQSQLGSTYSGSFSGEKTMKIQAEGTSISVEMDSTEIITATDSSHTAEGYFGMRIDTGSSADNLVIDDLTASDAGTLRVNIGQTGNGIRII